MRQRNINNNLPVWKFTNKGSVTSKCFIFMSPSQRACRVKVQIRPIAIQGRNQVPARTPYRVTIVSLNHMLDLLVAVRLDLIVLEMLLALLVEFSVCTPTQKEEGDHDEDTADDGCPGQRLSSTQPVDDRDQENGQECGNRRKDG